MKTFSALFLLSLFLLAGCNSYQQDDYEELVVIEGYAVANRPLPHIRVSKTLPVDREYNLSEAAITNALVQLVLLDENGNDEEIFPYNFSEYFDRFYVPSAEAMEHTVLPMRTYRLDVSFNHRDEIIRAYTTVPDQVKIIGDVEDFIVYQSDEQLEILIAEGRRTQKQSVYVFSAIAQNPVVENLTPFFRASVDDGNIELVDLINNASGLINEGNFQRNEDGSVTLRFPWIGVAFFGPNLVVTSSVDTNLDAIVRSQQLQLGGSTLPPGEIPNLIYNVEGGIGVFGSLSSDTARTNFVRPSGF
ncbi:MAG: DUF4249 family protein [Balneolaceae bacterium]|nr:MAG: DUF4249 family protein [Balneolaceae bacterium]